MCELQANGFKFHVLSDEFLLHHGYRNKATMSQNERSRKEQRTNFYSKFIKVLGKYNYVGSKYSKCYHWHAKPFFSCTQFSIIKNISTWLFIHFYLSPLHVLTQFICSHQDLCEVAASPRTMPTFAVYEWRNYDRFSFDHQVAHLNRNFDEFGPHLSLEISHSVYFWKLNWMDTNLSYNASHAFDSLWASF